MSISTLNRKPPYLPLLLISTILAMLHTASPQAILTQDYVLRRSESSWVISNITERAYTKLIMLTGSLDQFEGLLVNFATACPGDLTNATLSFLNNDTTTEYSGTRAHKIALIIRGGCTWSQKLSTAITVAALHDYYLTGAVIYDDQPLLPDLVNATTVDLARYPDDDVSPDNNKTFLPAVFVTHDVGIVLVNSMYRFENQNAMVLTNGGALFYARVKIERYLDQPVGWVETMRWVVNIVVLGASMIAGVILYRRYRRYRQHVINNTDLALYVRPLGGNLRGVIRRHKVPSVLKRSQLDTFAIVEYDPDKVVNSTCAICLEDFDDEAEIDLGVPRTQMQVEGVGKGVRVALTRMESVRSTRSARSNKNVGPEGRRLIRLLPCGHGFDLECIDPWLTTKSSQCPICKYECLPHSTLIEQESSTEHEETATVNEGGVVVSIVAEDERDVVALTVAEDERDVVVPIIAEDESGSESGRRRERVM